MKLIIQPTCFTCGQACIAMIAEKSVDEVIKDMKTDGATSIGQLIEILDFYGIRHAEKNKRISKKNPVPFSVFDFDDPYGRGIYALGIALRS